MSRESSEVLAAYEAGLVQMRRLLAIVPADLRDTPPAPGEWSARQVIVHLSDSELIGAVRLRRTLAEHDPLLHSYDEQLWSERLDYDHTSAEEAAGLTIVLRRWSLALLKRASADDWQRRCILESQGAELTLVELVQNYVDHVNLHIAQLETIRARLAA